MESKGERARCQGNKLFGLARCTRANLKTNAVALAWFPAIVFLLVLKDNARRNVNRFPLVIVIARYGSHQRAFRPLFSSWRIVVVEDDARKAAGYMRDESGTFLDLF